MLIQIKIKIFLKMIINKHLIKTFNKINKIFINNLLQVLQILQIINISKLHKIILSNSNSNFIIKISKITQIINNFKIIIKITHLVIKIKKIKVSLNLHLHLDQYLIGRLEIKNKYLKLILNKILINQKVLIKLFI